MKFTDTNSSGVLVEREIPDDIYELRQQLKDVGFRVLPYSANSARNAINDWQISVITETKFFGFVYNNRSHKFNENSIDFIQPSSPRFRYRDQLLDLNGVLELIRKG